jgi:hypothetical protein
MSYTGEQILAMAIAIKNDLSELGTITTDEQKEYRLRAPFLLDAWQHEIVKASGKTKEFEVACFRKKNLLSDVNQFRIVEYTCEAQEYSGKGANCFYFEVDGDCTVTIQEDGADVSGYYVFNEGEATAFTGTISLSVPTGTKSFLTCKGIITPASQTSTITMTFSGDYYYRHNNRALCPYKFQTADKVPDFKPWYKVEMPSDFKSRSQVVNEFPQWQYAEAANHKWEGENELYVLFSYEGTIRIRYTPIPAKITSLTQTIEIDENTAISGAYYLAEQFCAAEEETSMAAVARRKYAELKAEASVRDPLSPEQIIDVYDFT